MPDPDWLPDLIIFDGDWHQYIEDIHNRFVEDFSRSHVMYNGCRVTAPRDPETDGKGKTFWHCVSEGHNEDERVPELNRCSRIAWIRSIIENSHHEQVEVWTNKRGNQKRHLLWFLEEFLVVLGEGKGYFVLITAYLTDKDHSKRKFRKERDAYNQNG